MLKFTIVRRDPWWEYSLINAMCQRWPAICSQFAMQSRSYCNCYEFEAKILVKNKWKKLYFSLMLMAVTSEFKEGFLKSGAQTLLNPRLSADYAVILVRFPHSPLSAFRFPFHVPCSSTFPARSPFFVGVTSYYCCDTTVVSSNSDFRKHLSAMSVLIRKKIFEFLGLSSIEKVSDWFIPGRVYWRVAANPVSY